MSLSAISCIIVMYILILSSWATTEREVCCGLFHALHHRTRELRGQQGLARSERMRRTASENRKAQDFGNGYCRIAGLGDGIPTTVWAAESGGAQDSRVTSGQSVQKSEIATPSNATEPEEGKTDESEPEAICICEALCTAKEMNTDCPVCGAEGWARRTAGCMPPRTTTIPLLDKVSRSRRSQPRGKRPGLHL